MFTWLLRNTVPGLDALFLQYGMLRFPGTRELVYPGSKEQSQLDALLLQCFKVSPGKEEWFTSSKETVP